MTILENVACPCCEKVSERNEWYELSNDNNAVCPKCDNYVDYTELNTNNEFYAI